MNALEGPIAPSLDLHLASRLRPHLLPGEVLAWVGAPAPGRYLAGGAVRVVGGLLIGWLALGFAEEAVARADAFGRLAAAVFGTASAVAALWLLGGAARAFVRGQAVVFGLTDRRALVLREGRPARLLAYGAGALGPVEVAGRGATRDVWFATDPAAEGFMPPTGALGPAPGTPVREPGRVGFVGLPADGRVAALAAALAALAPGGSSHQGPEAG